MAPKPGEYSIAVICPLEVEVLAMIEQLEEEYDEEFSNDCLFTLGRIGQHNVVLTSLPAGRQGHTSAAVAAQQTMSKFLKITCVLLVGIAGGVPSEKNDIRLGDIVVSFPHGRYGGVVQYDFGKDEEQFQCGGQTNSVPQSLLAYLTSIQLRHGRRRSPKRYIEYLEAQLADGLEKPPAESDRLFPAAYTHQQGYDCTSCDEMQAQYREAREGPRVHYGLIASGNRVMKNAKKRDIISKEHGGIILAYEMEAAGLMNFTPCLVIRGISDYADSHKPPGKGWHQYAAAVAAAYAREFIENVPVKAVLMMETTVKQQAHCLIPFRRNKQFVGRDSQLRELMAKLSPENEDDCQRVAIAGLGGIGKTQIALEIAFRMQEAFTDCSVFWVPAIDITSFEKAYRDIGKILQIPGLDDDKADVKSLVAAYMGKESMGRWLLVIDNVDDLELFSQKAGDGDESGSTTFADYLPFSRKGSILFTTRNRVVAIKQAEVEVAMVDEMDQTDSQKLLEVSLINKDCSEQKNNVAKLLDLLAYLPLAIKQAAAFMNENQMSIATYLDICVSDNERFVELLSKDFEDKGRYKTIKNPIALTWLISFRQVLSHDHLAAEYLYFMSCVAQQDILQSLLPEASRLKQEMALGLLKAYAFITQREGQKSFDIHRLVQIAIRNWLREKNELHIWTGRTLTRMTELFPPFDYKKREECAKYLPHAEYILDFTQFSPDFGDDLEELLFKVGEYFHKIGKYVKAEQRYRRRFMMMTEMLGAEHPDTLGSMANLGLVLRSLTQYDEAEQIHRKCLKLNMEALDANHRNTLRSMNNLAVVLSVRGKHREAEQMHRKNLKLNIEMLGEDHPNTLRSMNNLAMVLDKQGSNAEAEGLMRQRLKLKEQTIGINHPSTLGSMNNLALILKKQGKYEESEKLHRHTLKLTEEVLGADHPDTIRSMNNLGSVLMKQGNYKEAESMNRQVLKLKEQAFGPDHPDTLRSLKNLSISLEKQGKHDVLGENV